MDDPEIRPFTIAVPQGSLDDLAARLARTRWPDELPGVGWDMGIPLERTRELAAGLGSYDWRAEEQRLNALPQVETTVDGQRLHAVHVPADADDAPALVLLHGWPGTYADYLPLVEELRGRFHLVVPSLPGFGFSGPPTERGWGPPRIAAAVVELLRRLGHERFLLHGEDTGAIVGRHLAVAHPGALLGLHVTEALGDPPDDAELSEEDARRVGLGEAYMSTRSGYAMVQSQAPTTVAYGLTDSPAGLLAWIAEKLLCWSGPRTALTDADVLRTVSIYWHTQTAASSCRVYFEGSGDWAGAPEPVTVPTAVQVFADPLGSPVRAGVERFARVVRWTEEGDAAGHFPMLEATSRVAADLEAFAAEVA